MEIGAKRAYLVAVKEHYNKSSKKQKTQILNEFCCNCNYNRKHAIKLLSKKSGPRAYTKRVGAPRKYSEAVSKKLAELWLIMGNPCSSTLKEALPQYIVTGDDDLLVLDGHQELKILKPKKFLDVLN